MTHRPADAPRPDASSEESSLERVTPGLWRLGVGFVNAYAIQAEAGWVLVDTGPPLTPRMVQRAVDHHFGHPPTAIVLTHGHADHAGGAETLATNWDVPVYAHALEMPFVTGRADYPPKDPTTGGAIGFLARLLSDEGCDLGDRVRALPDDGRVPGLPNWRWIHVPGHTVGQVALFCDADRTLVAGDALATMDLDAWSAQLRRTRKVCRPPAPFTTDWRAAQRSVEHLADLNPQTLAAGHGLPMRGSYVAGALHRLARHFRPPTTGRYAEQPARFDAEGVAEVPPPVSDPLPKQLVGGTLAAFVAGTGLVGLARLLRRS